MAREYITYRNCLLKHPPPALSIKDQTPSLKGPVSTQLSDPLPFPPKPWGPGFHKSLERGSAPIVVHGRIFRTLEQTNCFHAAFIQRCKLHLPLSNGLWKGRSKLNNEPNPIENSKTTRRSVHVIN